MPKRILVVDDEPDVLRIIQATLAQDGYEVDTAGSGSTALERLREQQPDLVVLDIMMPGMDGIEVCRRIKQDASLSAIPVVFLTAKGGGSALAEGLGAGALMYLQKPFNTHKLRSMIAAVLGDGVVG